MITNLEKLIKNDNTRGIFVEIHDKGKWASGLVGAAEREHGPTVPRDALIRHHLACGNYVLLVNVQDNKNRKGILKKNAVDGCRASHCQVAATVSAAKRNGVDRAFDPPLEAW